MLLKKSERKMGGWKDMGLLSRLTLPVCDFGKGNSSPFSWISQLLNTDKPDGVGR